MHTLKDIQYNPFNQLLYTKGFLFGKANIVKPLAHWKAINISDYVLYYDKEVSVALAQEGTKWILLFGLAVDIEDGTSDNEKIVEILLNRLSVNELEFHERLDWISGRYMIVYSDGDSVKVVNDATGMRTVFYSKESNIIASHAELLKDIIGSSNRTEIRNKWAKEYGTYHIPGHFTPFEDVYFLTPNTYLVLETGIVNRFYPRKPLKLVNYELAAKNIDKLVRKQLNLLTKEYDHFLFSLSAGIDSRTTLSLMKDYKEKTKFFTYFKKEKDTQSYSAKTLEIDRSVVKNMVDNLGLNHSFIEINQNLESEEFNHFKKILRKNTFRPHNYQLAKQYYDKLDSKALHIRSNILEIGRYFYRSNRKKLPKTMSGIDMAHCLSPKAIKNSEIIQLFEEFYQTVQMDNIYNYDPYDILYWEYRMGTWHALLILESDPSHETFIPFNARIILEQFLSVSTQTKKKYYIFKEIIDNAWPVLNYWQINSKITLNNLIDRDTLEHGLPLSKAIYRGGNIADKDKVVEIRHKNYVTRSRFNMSASAPEKGDFAEVILPVDPSKLVNRLLILQVRSVYENPKNKGRLAYQILVNDKVILQEDVAMWRETNQICLDTNAFSEKINEIKIRVIALRNCEDWGWGEAGSVVIERVSIRNRVENRNEKVTASSPYSQLL